MKNTASSFWILKTLTFIALCASNIALAADLPAWPKKGQVIQRLSAFDNPEGAIFSADGKYVYISNSADLGRADKGLRWTHNAGYISKLEVQQDGTLKMVNEKLVTGLTGPLGMAISTVGTRKFPAGTIFVAESWAFLAESNGGDVTDAKILDPKIVGFNAEGKVLGTIKVGAGSVAAKRAGVIGIMGNAMASDKNGNLYLADTGAGASQYMPPVVTKGGGVYLFPLASLDALAEGRDAPLSYVPTPNGGADGVEAAPDGSIHVNTVGSAAGLKDPAEGGMYKLSESDFKNGVLSKPFNRGLGGLDGLTFANGKRLDTEVMTNNIVVTPLTGNAVSYRLTFDKDIKLAGPADIAVRKNSDGNYLLVVPELSATTPNDKKNQVTVIKLPADF